MSPEREPSLVYIVKGEGVRDNSWEVQQSGRPVLYTNPPLEQLDSVPTPLGSTLSIRIFQRGTTPMPNFLPSSQAPEPPAAQEIAPPSVTPKPSQPVPSKPTQATIAPPAKASKPAAPASQHVSNPPQQGLQRPSRARRLRNFRRLSATIIADPRRMPGAKSVPPVTTPPSIQLAQTARPAQPAVPTQPAVPAQPARPSQPTRPAQAVKPQPSVAQKRAKPSSVTPPVVSTAAPLAAVSSPPKTAPRVTVAPRIPVQTSQKTHMVLSPPKAKQRPVTQIVSPKPPKGLTSLTVSKGAPPLPELKLPSPSSPIKTTRKPVTSPSAFGRWKTTAPASPKDQRSPLLPSPSKRSAEKVRAKPWEKLKAGTTSQASFEVQRKAMDSIIAKTLAHQPKSSKMLPPLTPLTPPAVRPKVGPVSPKVPPNTAAGSPAERASASTPTPKPVKTSPREPESVKDVSSPAPRQAQRPVQTIHHRTVVDVCREERIDTTKRAKPPSAASASVTKETARKAPVAVSAKPPERKLLQKEMPKPRKVVAHDEAISPAPIESVPPKALAKKPSTTEVTVTPSTKKRAQPVKATTDARAAPSPRSSIDRYEIGTAARPIVTKEDQVVARRKREAAAAKANALRQSEQTSQKKTSSSEVQKEKRQRVAKSAAAPGAPSAPRAPARTESNDLFSPEIQQSMKSVIEQILWTVRHFKQTYAISSHEEMKSNKQKILRFIQTHLEEAATVAQVKPAAQEPSVAPGAVEADGALKRQSSVKGQESAKRKEDFRHKSLKELRMYDMFKSWRKHLESGKVSLESLVVDAKPLRQKVMSLDRDTLHFTVPDLLTRLGELEELSFSIRQLTSRMRAAGRAIGLYKRTGEEVEAEFQDAFKIIKSAVRWVLFLSEQASMTWKKLQETSKDAMKFATDVRDTVIKTTTDEPDENSKSEGIVQAMRKVKSAVGHLQKEMDLGDDGVSLSDMATRAVRPLGEICLKAQKQEKGPEAAAAALPPDQDRSGSRSAAARSVPIPRRPRHDDKQESSQEFRIKRRAPGSGSAAGLQSSATQKAAFEPQGRVRTPNGSSMATTGPMNSVSPNSLPVVPRRAPSSAAPGSGPSSQAGPGAQKPGSASLPRWNKGGPNLMSLIQRARTVDQVRDEKSRDSSQVGAKRKVEDGPDQKGSDTDSKPAPKKRRVTFAPVLVQGEQSTSYSKAALQSLFWDGYDLLGDTTELQKTAVEERARQLSRGSVVATFGFIRSYIGALKAAKDRQNCQRPAWVRLPYTPTMKRDIVRFKERRGNGLRSAPGPS